MRRSRKLLLGFVAVLLLGLVGGYWYERPLLLTGTGYAAHNACALQEISGRSDADRDLPPNPLVPLLRWSTDGEGTTASLLGVLSTQRAWATEGYGCTVADEAPDLPARSPITGGNRFTDAVAPSEGAETDAALDAAFDDDLGTRAVVAIKGGSLVAERYAAGFDADTPQLGWSLTKSLTNLVVGRLVQQGAISVDDDHLRSEWTDGRANITIRDLMQMTSGLSWDETYSLGTPITRMLYLEPDMGGYVASREGEFAPGTHLRYSSGDTNVLCAVLAERTGAGADLVRRELFAPLGLESALVEPDGAGSPVCSSYGWATPREWATVGQFVLQHGIWEDEPLLPEGWIAESTKSVEAADVEDRGYASGWWANRTAEGELIHPSLPADAFWGEGHDGQWLVVVPSEDLVVVRLGFTPTTADDGAVDLTAALISSLR